jgi:hypothetical protein
MELRIEGAENLSRLAVRLKDAGRNDLRKELLASIRTATKPTIAEVRASALDTLPSRGGLAALIAASRMSTETRLSGKRVGVRLRARNARNIRRMDKGRLRHPLFGNEKHWFTQSIPSGWFSEPIEKAAPEIRWEIGKGMARVTNKIAR